MQTRNRALGKGCFVLWPLAVLLSCPAVAANTAERSASEALLEDAFGYASVWWYEKAGEICDQVIAESTDPKILARAHWVKAVAIRSYAVEYRDDSLSALYGPEAEAVKRMAPELYLDTLARLDVLYAFYVADKNDPAATLERYRKECEATADSDPLGAYVLAQATWQAAVRLKEAGEDAKMIEGYRKRGTELLERACKWHPNSFEFQSYRLTFLAETGQLDQAIDVGKMIAERFTPPGPYEFDRDPYCLYAAAVSMKDHNQAIVILENREKSPDAGGWVHLELALDRVGEATSNTEKARILGDFVSEAEEGKFSTRGYDRRALASGYYKWAHQLSVLNQIEQTLAAYGRLQEISPNYAEVHYNKAVVLTTLAQSESNPEKKRELLTEARNEYELQLKHNWKGGAVSTCRGYIDQVDKMLEGLKKPTPTPKDSPGSSGDT